MAIFHFKLKTLHRLKVQLEDQAKNRLGLAVSIHNAETAKLNHMKSVIAATLDEFREMSGRCFSAGDVRDYNFFIDAMKKKAKIQKAAVDKAKEAVDEARRLLVLAARQREMFDKLREKAFARYLEDEKYSERLVVDGLISYRGNTLNNF